MDGLVIAARILEELIAAGIFVIFLDPLIASTHMAARILLQQSNLKENRNNMSDVIVYM